MKSIFDKKSDIVEQLSSEKQRTSLICHQFSVYLKLLFGQDLNLQDELLLSNKWGKFNQRQVQSPQGVLCFPNPDHKSQKVQYLKPFEFLRFLDKCILGQNNQQKQLFIYCIYLVFKNLECSDDPQIEKSSFQSFMNQDTINDYSFDVIQDMTIQFKQSIRKLKKSKYCDFLKLNIDELLSQDDKKLNYGRYYQYIHKSWKRSGKICSDYLTLVRNIVLIILAKNGFHTELFFSEDGSQIFCLLELDENNLTKVASKHNIMKQINISFFDLFSFEPVDKNLRPLRLNNRLWKQEEYKVSETFNYLKPKIIELLEEINIKKLAREVNQAGINQQQFQYGKVDLENDDNGPNDDEWYAYYQWLVFINKIISEIRQDYRLDNDTASLLQNQVQPFQLFLARFREQYPHITKLNIKQEQNQKIYQIFQDFKNQHLQLIEYYKQYCIFSGLSINKQIKLLKKEDLATRYLKSFKDSINISNYQNKLLFTLWDRLNIKPFTPFLGFQFSYKTLQFQLTKQINFWQKYQINEFNQISLFSTSERLKLLQLALNQILNINDIIEMGYARLFCIHDYYELYGNCNNYYEQIREHSNFYQKKIFAIREQWKLNSLWVIPQDMINQYFGQKVGLYFYYLSYFTFMMFPISLFGLIISILQWTVDDSKDMLTFIFAIIQMLWTNLLDDMWEEKQRIFNLREGQSDKHLKQTQRGNYIGSFGRSIESDNLNVFVSNSFIQNLFISAIILFLIVLTYFGLLVGLFNITLAMKDSFKEYDYLSLDVTITASINIILIHIFEIFYDRFVEILTNYENHQSIEAYETSFIIKIYILEFTSYISPLMFISYLSHPIKLYCYKDDCQLHAQQHFATLIIWLFFFRTIKYIYFTMQSLLNRININNRRMKLFIEDQSHMKPYTITQEKYGTLDDMKQLFIYNTLLSLFGYTFPISFFLVFLQSIAQIQADRAKFLYILQRPWPQNENTLGIWKVILKLIAYICLLSNSGSATIIFVNRYGGDSLLIFVLILFSCCAAKFFMGSVLGPSFYIEQLVQRQKNLLKQTFYQFKKKKISNSQQITDSKRYVIYKIYNTRNILEGQGKLQTISSRSNLSDHLNYVSQQSQIQIKSDQDMIFKRNKTKKKSALLIKIDQTIKQQNTNSVLQFFKQRNFNQQFKFQIFQGNLEQKEHLREKLYQFNYKLLQLANYKFLWTERRYSTRYLHLKRKHQMIRNLDWRKTQITQQQHQLMIEEIKIRAEKKFRKKIQSFSKSNGQDDQKELQMLQERYRKFVEKHSWLQTRKVVVLKVKGLWFNSNRKQVKKQQALLTIYDFIRKCRMMDKVKNDSYLQTQFDRRFDFSELHLYNMRKYMDLFSSLDIQKQNEFLHPQSTKPIEVVKLYANHLRSQDYRYWCEQIKDTFIFDIQKQKLQEIALTQYFEEVFPPPKFKLIKLLQNQTWNGQDQNGDSIVIKYIKAKINHQLIPFQQSHSNFGVFYSEATQICHIANIVDQIDEFNYKGYILNIHKITGFKTLEQVIKYRQFYGFPYTEKQLRSFIHANLQLFKERCYGDIASKSYFYHINQYALLYADVVQGSISQQLDCQNLVKVVLEMMNYHNELSDLNHPLKTLLEDLLKEDLHIDQILEDYFYQYQNKFIEMDINNELQIPQYSLKDKIQDNLHKLHIYQKFNQNIQFEEQIQINNQLLEISILTLKDIHEDNLEKLIFDIDLQKTYITNTILNYIKFQKDFFQLDIFQLKQVIYPLKIICKKIKQIIKELSLQFDCSRLSNSQKKIVLNVSELENLDASIIKKLRKHQAYIDRLQKFNKKIQRYQNQLLCIKGLYYYWERNFNKAIKIISKCIHIQTDIILFNKDLNIDCSVNEIQPEDLNFLQNTPREMQFIHPLGINYKIKQLYQQMPKHTMQYIYYKYIQTIIMIDQNTNSNHQLLFKEFCDLELDSETFIYFKYQIMCLIKEEIPYQFMESQNECILGQYIVILLNKWIEQYQIDRELLYFQDDGKLWLQIMNSSFISRSKQNQSILKQIFTRFEENNSTISIQIKIRCLHLLLHFDDNQMPNFIQINRENDFSKIVHLEDSKILQLKALYNKYFSQIIVQFQHRNLIQLKVYQYLSIILIFSPKYYENFSADSDNYFILNQINQELNKLEGIEEIEYQLVKRNLIQQNFDKDQVLNQSDSLQIKIFKTYFVLQKEYLVNQNFINFFDKISEYFPKKRSLLCMIYIQYHIFFNSKEVAELMITLCRKLIEFKAPIFKNHHQGFAEDLIYLELQLNNQQLTKIQQHYALERTDARDNQQMQLFQDNVHAFLYNFIYQFDFEMQYKILDNHLQKLILIPKKEIEQLIQYCQTYQVYLGNRLGYDLELILSYQNTQETVSQILIYHFNARYYLLNYDFDRAFAMSKQVINFIYSLQIDSFLIYKQTPSQNIFHQNDIVRIIKLIEEPIYRQNNQIEPQLLNFVDKEFIHFSILLHIDISIQLFQLKKLYQAIPSIVALFDLFEIIENDEFINYLLKIYAEYFTLLSQNNQYHIQIQEELLQSVRPRVKKLNKRKHKIRQEFLKKQLTIPQTTEDKAQLEYKISLIDYEINVFRCKDVNQKAFLNFSINAAEKSLSGYLIIAHRYKQDTLSEIIHLQILLALNYKQLGLQFISRDYTINAENNLNKIYRKKNHPLKAYYYYRMGQFQRLHQQILQSHLQELIRYQIFSKQELKYYFYNLAIGNKQVTQIVDHYFNFNDKDKYLYQIKEFLAYQSNIPQLQILELQDQIRIDELLQDHLALDFSGKDYFLKSAEIMAYCKQDNWMTIQFKK